MLRNTVVTALRYTDPSHRNFELDGYGITLLHSM
jgi:hypothetical protein